MTRFGRTYYLLCDDDNKSHTYLFTKDRPGFNTIYKKYDDEDPTKNQITNDDRLKDFEENPRRVVDKNDSFKRDLMSTRGMSLINKTSDYTFLL